MKKSYGVNELRRMYLDFFESKGHLVMKSFSLVPHNDNSLLLINAGMAPLKPYFTGQEIPPRRRVTTCQKCVRTGDIENVGKTARHLTFFEMLGNFSFGDYFKHEAIAWSWEFLTKVLGLEEDRLYPSIYGEDEEAYEIWTREVGVPGEKITRFYRDPETGECTLHEIRSISTTEQFLRCIKIFPAFFRKSIPEIKGKVADLDCATCLPTAVHTFRYDAVPLKIKHLSDVHSRFF